jgi:hypothetical protein
LILMLWIVIVGKKRRPALAMIKIYGRLSFWAISPRRNRLLSGRT